MDFSQCTLCPRRCGADRTRSNGLCGVGGTLRVARAALHFGEEPCISGSRGSGTVFFSGCALRCVFCQNSPISREGFGEDISESRLGEILLELQEQGAHNINLVTASHFAPLVGNVLRKIRPHLRIPVVCNCGGYESAEVLAELDGLIDVYLPDLKYFSSEKSFRYSGIKDYFSVASSALSEMYRQVGSCRFDEEGMLQSGLLIRHLILPEGKKDSFALLDWIAENFPTEDIRVSLMRQYTPCGDLSNCPELNRTLYSLEYSAVTRHARSLGILGYEQGRGCDNLNMTPHFDLSGVKGKETI